MIRVVLFFVLVGLAAFGAAWLADRPGDVAITWLGWRRHQPLHVLLLRTFRIPRPVTVKVRDEYAAAQAWIELQRELPFEGTPVLSDAEFERASEEIRAITSEAGQPVFA